MRHRDLFSGIGGFALAAQWVWGKLHHLVSFCEKDSFCQRVLAKNFPGIPCYDDIHTFTGGKDGTIDLLTAGFPCQPMSVAGKRGGVQDDRYLWPETLRVIQEDQPRWVIGENVFGLVSMVQQQSSTHMESHTLVRHKNCDVYEAIYTQQEYMLLESLCQDLETEGYDVQPFVIPACAVNAPHRRDRVWIVAYNEGQFNGENYPESLQRQVQQFGIGACTTDVADPDRSEWRTDDPRRGNNQGRDVSDGIQCREEISSRSGLRSQETLAYATQHLPYWGRASRTPRGSQFTNGYSNVSHTSSTGSQKWQQQWQSEPAVGRVAHGIPHRVDRLRGLGNAIVPHLAAVIMNGIREIEESLSEVMSC
jgi:DNA (cytosine-5)-methyltransferase 1